MTACAPEGHYRYYHSIFQGVPMPFAFVDLDRFDANVQSVLSRAQGVPVRVASKSVRCIPLLRRIQAASPLFLGIMAYSVREAAMLAANGFDDLLVAYPAWGDVAGSGIVDALKSGSTITLMADSAAHVEHLNRIGAAAGTIIPVCMDLDMSTSFAGVYFGVRRSGIRTVEQAVGLWRLIDSLPYVSLAGVMGYEAQVASIPDRVPGALLYGHVLRYLKRRSVPHVAERRARIVKALREARGRPRFVNGGGTGSIETTRLDSTVTEITVGSAFYAPALFDHFAAFHHEPAIGFAIEIVRLPAPGYYTALGGGYMASGEAGTDRLPVPYWPRGACLTPHEGVGEVQTPFRYTGSEPLAIGDPLFMRPAKAGELCERFDTLYLVSKGRIVDRVPTYRGEGHCFL